jgi:hypothetical protein
LSIDDKKEEKRRIQKGKGLFKHSSHR